MVRKEHIYLCVHEKTFSSPIKHENLSLWLKYKQLSFSTFPTPVLMLFICCPNTAHITCGGLTHIVRRLSTIGAEYEHTMKFTIICEVQMGISSLYHAKPLPFHVLVEQERRYSIPLKEERIALIFSGSVKRNLQNKVFTARLERWVCNPYRGYW